MSDPRFEVRPRGTVTDAEVEAGVATMTRLRGTTAWWASPDVARAVLEAAQEARQ